MPALLSGAAERPLEKHKPQVCWLSLIGMEALCCLGSQGHRSLRQAWPLEMREALLLGLHAQVSAKHLLLAVLIAYNMSIHGGLCAQANSLCSDLCSSHRLPPGVGAALHLLVGVKAAKGSESLPGV